MGVGISASDGRRVASINPDAADDSIGALESSPSSATLDRMLGQNRAPVRRGQSFSKRMDMLGERLHSIAGDFESAFSVTDLSLGEQLKHQVSSLSKSK